MAYPGCRRWQHKGRTSTNPTLNRRGGSRPDCGYEDQWCQSEMLRMSACGYNRTFRGVLNNVPLPPETGHPRLTCCMPKDDPNPTLAGNRSELPSAVLTARELTNGQGFASTNKPDKGRNLTYRAGPRREFWCARP